MRDSKSVGGTLERVTFPAGDVQTVQYSCTGVVQTNTKSLENIINQAKVEADREQKAVEDSGEEIYLDMSRQNKSSDYLEMERLQHFQNFNAKN